MSTVTCHFYFGLFSEASKLPYPPNYLAPYYALTHI